MEELKVEKPENEKPSDWYDDHTGKGRAYFQSEFHQELYPEIVNFLDRGDRIIDLGCGGGRLIQALQKEFIPKSYLGIDFSSARIEVAKSAYGDKWSFKVGDITKYNKIYEKFDTFVLVTVLEHINEDRKVLENIPFGSKVIMANPNKMSESHVRQYISEEYIVDRYNDLLEFQDVKILYNADNSPRMFIHKCRRL